MAAVLGAPLAWPLRLASVRSQPPSFVARPNVPALSSVTTSSRASACDRGSVPIAAKLTAAGALLFGGLCRQHYRRQRGSRVARRARAYRMPLPPDVHEFEAMPRWKVLYDAVKNCDPEDAVIPTWKLKPRLGIYSPTPQYAPLHYIEPKPFWMKASFIKKKKKKYYNKMDLKKMERLGQKPRYLPDPSSRIDGAGARILRNMGFKGEEQAWKVLRKLSAEDLLTAIDGQKDIRLAYTGKDMMINERPGYQQDALKEMAERLKRVDIVLEVRDARIPFTSAHPDIPEWTRGKPRVICLTMADLVPRSALQESIAAMNTSERDRGVPVVAVDAQRGCPEIEDLRLEMMKAGAFVNRRRKRKGVNPRAVRAIMLGFPNVGKSSLINRLTGRKVAKRTAWAGTTRKMTWHKIGGFRNTELEFLDCPGMIPFGFAKRYTKEQQALLCMCRIFGDKVLDREQTAYDLVYLLTKLDRDNPSLVEKTVWRETKRIYGVNFKRAVNLEEPFLPRFVPVANPEPFCGKMLKDFNDGYWGKIQLEPPPIVTQTRENWSHIDPNAAVTTSLALASGEKEVVGRPRQILPDRRKISSMLPVLSLRDRFERQREKEPVFVATKPGQKGEGLFEGW